MRSIPGQGDKEQERVRGDWVCHHTVGKSSTADGGWLGVAFGEDKGGGLCGTLWVREGSLAFIFRLVGN